METETYRRDFLEAGRVRAEAMRDFLRGAFVDEASNRLADAEEVADFVRHQYEGTGYRGRRIQVDGYAKDDADNSVMFLIADWSDEEELTKLGEPEARRIFGMLRGFVEEAISGRLTDGSIEESTEGFDLASDIKNRAEDVTRYRFYLVSDRLLSSRVRDWPEERIAGVPTEFHIWDIGRFHRAHQSVTGRDTLEVSFAEDGNEGLPCIHLVPGDDYEAYLCVIPGSLLAETYEKYGSRLLEGNVRSFLSTKGRVNARIQGTIRAEPEMFFAYNNGIAATASAVEVESSRLGLKLVGATDFQIVNGGQTTASLAFARRKDGADLSRTFVQMKLSVVSPDRAMKLIPDIAKYANSQNKVSDADFFSNHTFHVRIEEFSRRIWAPAIGGSQYGTHWFYERARGQFLNEQARLSKSERGRYLMQNPRSQVITKTDLAKFENSWRRLPHKVSLGAQKNFLHFAELVGREWDSDHAQFNEEYFKRIVVLAILFRHVEKLVTHQNWYENGYRAQIVTYTVAKLRDQIGDLPGGRELDMTRIWARQACPPELDEQLGRIAKGVHSVLTNPKAGVQNVTEWAKREACWTQVQELRLEFDKGAIGTLASMHEGRLRRQEAVAVQQIDSGIGVQTAVVSIPPEEWRQMRKWGEEQGLLTSTEVQLLGVATMIPKRIPSERQCAVLMQVRGKLTERGFRAKH